MVQNSSLLKWFVIQVTALITVFLVHIIFSQNSTSLQTRTQLCIKVTLKLTHRNMSGPQTKLAPNFLLQILRLKFTLSNQMFLVIGTLLFRSFQILTVNNFLGLVRRIGTRRPKNEKAEILKMGVFRAKLT